MVHEKKKKEQENPHDLLLFMLKYLVIPTKKPEGRLILQGELEKRAQDQPKTQLSPLEEIRQSIDAVVRSSPLLEEPSFEGKMAKESSSSITYSFSKKTSQRRNYLLSVRYHSTDEEERMEVGILFDEEIESETIIRSSSKRKESKQYSFSLLRKKEPLERIGYEVHLSYDHRNREEQATIEYRTKGYTEQLLAQKSDFSERVPFKVLHMKPKNVMGGALGYTYLGESFMAMRDDLIGALKKEVDIHESIHTPDEYETRVLTWWMMEKAKQQYRK